MNTVWHHGKITAPERRALNNLHKPALVWITGLPASGKSTIASELEYQLIHSGIMTFVLDGDNMRHGLNKDLGFSAEDRRENLRRVGEVAKLFVEAGILTIAAFASPYKADRLMIRELFNDGEFIEVYLNCDLSVCESRDPKGHYKKARAGEIKNFTGVSDPYEPPDSPEIVLDTEKISVVESVDRIICYLKEKRII